MNPKRKLNVGDKVPDFWTRDINGKEVDSREFSRHTLIVFLRYAGCPFCNLAIYRLAHEQKLLQKNGCDVVAFVQSTEDNIEENIVARQKELPPFPIVSDQQQDIYKLFGVSANVAATLKHSIRNASHWMDATFNKGFTQANVDGSGFMVPAYFLIDKKGVIQIANYDASLYEDSEFTPIYEQLTFGPK